MNLISKIIVLIVILLIPVAVFYTYSVHENIGIIRQQIDIANKNRQTYFMRQVESKVGQMAFFSDVAYNDPDVLALESNSNYESEYNKYQHINNLLQKITLYSLSYPWTNQIVLYFPNSKQVVTDLSNNFYTYSQLKSTYTTTWTMRTVHTGEGEQEALSRFFVENKYSYDPFEAPVVVEISYLAQNIRIMLDTFKENGNNDPFIVTKSGQVITNHTANQKIIPVIAKNIDFKSNGTMPNEKIVRVNHQKYLMYQLRSPRLNITLVDYVPLQKILESVTKTRDEFYIAIALLLLVGAIAALLLYTQVQIPIRQLTSSVMKIKRGRFETRVSGKPNNDFNLLFKRFNEMASEIEHLIRRVYMEEIRVKEAFMKQLQSQVNPHFLYNSFAYIVSMAKMEKNSAIIAMAHNLADFYKYSTHNEELVTSLREEIRFVRNYLDIMRMQHGNIEYEIHIPPDMEDTIIPKLMIQPIVENSILHGLEQKLGDGFISIRGNRTPYYNEMVIEDNGVGLRSGQLERLQEQVKQSEKKDHHYGLWNVRNRLYFHFKERSELKLSLSELGGLKVRMIWCEQKKRDGDSK